MRVRKEKESVLDMIKRRRLEIERELRCKMLQDLYGMKCGCPGGYFRGWKWVPAHTWGTAEE